MIRSFRDKHTESVWNERLTKRFPPSIQRNAFKRLMHLNAARTLQDLRIPPGNKLHALRKDREGQHSVSINDQWRVCFRWADGDAWDVEIADYH